MELYVDGVLTGTWNGVAVASACVYALPDAASHALRYVATVTVGGVVKTYEATKTVSPHFSPFASRRGTISSRVVPG